MAKKFLINVLFKRGATALEEWIGKLIRHGMTTVGGGMMAAGHADPTDITAITGGLVALAGIAISVVRSHIQEKL